MASALKRTNRSLVFIGVLNILLLIIFSFFTQRQFEASSTHFRKNELKRLVTISLHSIQGYRDDFNAGLINREEAIEKITDQIRLLTYEDETQSNYIFMSAYDGTMLVQPYEPEREGLDQWDLRDTNGKYIIRELVSQAKQGNGWVDYFYYAPGSDIPQQKMSYVIGLQELECYIGTGMYMNDIEAAGKKYFRNIQIFFLIIAAFIIGSAIIVISPIILAVEHLAAGFQKIGAGPLIDPPEVDAEKFRDGSDAQRLVNGFVEITERLAKRNRDLIKKTEERETLVKEMNHRIKNNLQIVTSLLQVQIQHTDDDKLKKPLLDAVNRIESISSIHGMLYLGEDLSSISAENYISRISGYIIHSFGAEERISVEYDLDSLKLDMDHAVALGIITNEVLTNAAKYAFPGSGSGKVEIALKAGEGKKIFTISDNGTGINEPDKSGIGISLIRSLAAQLGGELSIGNEGGTSFRVIW